MDEADIAQRNQEQFDRLALQRQLNAIPPQGDSAKECEDCGEAIPEPRRMAAKGCTRCMQCQSVYERMRKERE